MSFLKTLFSIQGLLVAIYIIIGVFANTASPHFPSANNPDLWADVHSWIQYCISVLFWPLSFWNPQFTFGKWTGV